jgi:hypothetical protein
LTVGYTKCFSQVCQAYNNAIGYTSDLIESSIKHPFPDADDTFQPPSISLSDIRSDPQGRYFYYATLFSCLSLAVSLGLIMSDLWVVLGSAGAAAGRRRYTHAGTLAHFFSPLLYLLITLPVVMGGVGGGDEVGGTRDDGEYTWQLFSVLVLSGLMAALCWFPGLVPQLTAGAGYEIVPEVDELDLESHQRSGGGGVRRNDSSNSMGSNGSGFQQPWRTGKGTPKRGGGNRNGTGLH